MKKVILVGTVACGKTTLCQCLNGLELSYKKTQALEVIHQTIDTPGEYLQSKHLGGALAVYSYEADVVGLLISATEPFSLISPNVVSMCTRDVIGIITKIDHPDANIALATRWLELAGCKKIFKVNSIHSEGVQEILDYLKDS